MADPEDLARRQRRQVAGIEQHGAATEPEIQEKPRIAEGVVHESALDQLAHMARTAWVARCFAWSLPPYASPGLADPFHFRRSLGPHHQSASGSKPWRSLRTKSRSLPAPIPAWA